MVSEASESVALSRQGTAGLDSWVVTSTLSEFLGNWFAPSMLRAPDMPFLERMVFISRCFPLVNNTFDCPSVVGVRVGTD